MPLANFKPGVEPPVKPNVPVVQPTTFKGTIADDKYTDLSTLAPYVEGFIATITYFRQILGEDNQVREIDPAQSGAYQRYTRIERLDIRVQQPLDVVYDSNQALSVVKGTGIMFVNVIPNTFDYFVYETTRGRPSLFRIINSIRKTMNRGSVYEIEYQMVGYTDKPGDAKTYFDSLVSKSSETLYYHAERMVLGQSPLLRNEEHANAQKLEYDYSCIVSYYFGTFFNPDHYTLTLPGQDYAIYDKFLMDYLMRIVSVDEHPNIQRIKQLSTDNNPAMKQPQFWQAIATRNPVYIYQANRYMGLVNRTRFNNHAYILGAGMTTIDKYVYPIEADFSAMPESVVDKFLAEQGLVYTLGANGQLFSQGDNIYVSPTGNVQLYKRFLCDPYYVLSRQFYRENNDWCLLEKVTWDYLENRAISLTELVALTKQYYSLNRLEQFYYGPLLLTFIKDALESQYSS